MLKIASVDWICRFLSTLFGVTWHKAYASCCKSLDTLHWKEGSTVLLWFSCFLSWSKDSGGRPTPRREQKFRRIRRRYQTNQSRKPPPNIGAYKIPHLQSQFHPNPTPTQPVRSTPSYLHIHWPNRHPTKLSLTKARKIMMRSQHHHAV